jgi:CO/xanthine dehydrogenase FAD-binding subunit
MSLAHFAYVAPRSLSEAIAIIAARKADAAVLAGGTDLLPGLGKGDATPGLRPGILVSLRHIAELRPIVFDPEHGLTIGATARINELLAHEAVKTRYPAMTDAASQTANVQIRNMATLAGNICNARPCADNVPTLVARAARVELLSVRGSRMLELGDFILAPGKTAIEPDELLVRIHVPPPPAHSGASYQYASARSKVDLTSVCVAVYVVCEDAVIRQARIVLGAVGPTPLRAGKAESLLTGQRLTNSLLTAAGEAAASESQPITDIRASAEWRRRMVFVLAQRAIVEAVQRAGGKP